MAIISNGTTVVSGGGLSISVTPPTSLGAVGTYALLRNTSSDYRTAGTTVSGNLRYSNLTGGDLNSSGPGGTWRLMGINLGQSPQSTNMGTVCVRIS